MFFCVPRTKRTNRVLPQAAQTKQSTTSAETKTREQVHTDNSHPYYHAPADGSHPTSMTPTMSPYLICLQGVTHAYYHGSLARYYHGDITATPTPPQAAAQNNNAAATQGLRRRYVTPLRRRRRAVSNSNHHAYRPKSTRAHHT